MLDDTLGQVIPLYASVTGNNTFGVKHYADNVWLYILITVVFGLMIYWRLLFTTKWAILHLYHGEYKLHLMRWQWCPLLI